MDFINHWSNVLALGMLALTGLIVLGYMCIVGGIAICSKVDDYFFSL